MAFCVSFFSSKLQLFLPFPSSYIKRRQLTAKSTDNYSLKFLSLFKKCRSKEDLKRTKSLLIVHGLTEHKYLLGQFFRYCFHLGGPDIALSLFKSIKKPSVFLQNSMIMNLCDSGLYEDLLCVYLKCRVSGCPSDGFTFPSVIKACSLLGAFRIGRELHCVAFRTGYEKNVVIQTTLVDFYSKNGSMGSARKLLDRIPQPDLVSWNALIAGYSLNRLDQEAVEALGQLRSKGLKPNVSTLATVIPVCTRLGCFCFGKSLHGFVVKTGYLSDAFLVPALISMYAGDSDLSSSRKLFDSVLEKNATVWNAMIYAYTQRKKSFEAILMLRRMLRAELKPDLVTIVSVIPSFEDYSSIPFGESFHACVMKHGLETQLSISTALLSMYAKLGDVDSAEFLFDQMPSRNLFSWNAMVSGYANNGLWYASLALFYEMQLAGFNPDGVSIISVLSACSKLEVTLFGKSAHAFSLRKGIDSSNLDVSNALLMFYSDCGQLSNCFKLFHRMAARDTVSWNTLLSGCVRNGEVEKAVVLFRQMQKEGAEPDIVTLISVIPGYNRNEDLQQGFGNAILCILLFQMEKMRDISLWNAIISVHVQAKNAEQALACFRELLYMGLEPDNITVLGLISSCVQVNSASLTNSVMAWVIQKGFDKDLAVNNALIDLYGRCGSISVAKKLFGSLIVKDAVSWGVMINGFGLHGKGEAALDLFSQMQLSGVRPDEITYLSVLSACSHAGLVEQSQRVFKSMVEDRRISPRMEHYACMVDLLGRTGLVDEAFNYVKQLPSKPSRSMLESLLGACRIHGHVEVGEKISKMVLEMDPEDPESYVMLHNIYASAGRWEDANRVRSDLQRRRLKKVPGFSLYEHL